MSIFCRKKRTTLIKGAKGTDQCGNCGKMMERTTLLGGAVLLLTCKGSDHYSMCFLLASEFPVRKDSA